MLIESPRDYSPQSLSNAIDQRFHAAVARLDHDIANSANFGNCATFEIHPAARAIQVFEKQADAGNPAAEPSQGKGELPLDQVT